MLNEIQTKMRVDTYTLLEYKTLPLG